MTAARQAQGELAEVAMQVAQAALDGCEVESPSMRKEMGGSSVLVNSLMTLPTPSRSRAMRDSPCLSAEKPGAAHPASSPGAKKGPEPWNMSASLEPQGAPAARSGYRERLQSRGQQAMQRTLSGPARGGPMSPLATMPGQLGIHDGSQMGECALGAVPMPPVAPPSHPPQLHPGQCGAWAGQAAQFAQWMPMGAGDVSPMMHQQHPQPAMMPMGCPSGEYGGQAMPYGAQLPQAAVPGGAYQQAQLLSMSPEAYCQPSAASPYGGDLTPHAPSLPDGSPKSTGELMAVLMPQGFCMDNDQLAEQLRIASSHEPYED